MKLYVISGLSGSGKSTALHTLEDLGYYCIDNLPIGLLPEFVSQVLANQQQHLEDAAVGIDARNVGGGLLRFHDILEQIRSLGVECEIVFLEADDHTLLKRFSETRRRHPLTGENTTLTDAIRRERTLLSAIAENASFRADTSHMKMQDLRDLIRKRIATQPMGTMSILFESFAYKNGVPTDADFLFDVRYLPNPHWEPRLRAMSGLDKEVGAFLANQPIVKKVCEELIGFLETWIPRFEDASKSYLTIAIGCTGGQHRSVYLASELAEHFRRTRDNVLVRHRELS